jgi:hypothetical protein
MLNFAGCIVVGSMPHPTDKTKSWTGCRDAIQYMLTRIQEGLLIDDRGIQGGDVATVGAPDVADRISRDLVQPSRYLRTKSPLDKFRIGPDNPCRYVGIAGFSNHRKSTVLFTLAYLAACQGFKVLFVPRECTLEQAERKFIWLHAYRMKVADRLPVLIDSYDSDNLTQEHVDLVRWLGEDMKAKGILIDVRMCSDWAAVNSSVNAYVDEPYDVLAVDYIAHLDTPGAKVQKDAIIDVYRAAQDLSTSYAGGRGICVLSPMQISKTEQDKVAAGESHVSEWGVYEAGRIGVVEYHTDAPRGMDGLITVWSGPEFQPDGLIKVTCIKTRGKWFPPFFLKVDDHTQSVRFFPDDEAYALIATRTGAALDKKEPRDEGRRLVDSEEYAAMLEAINV